MAITFARATQGTGNGNQGGMSASFEVSNVTASGSTFTVPAYAGTITNWINNASSYPQTAYQTDSFFRGNLLIGGAEAGSFDLERSAALTLPEGSGWTSKSWTGAGSEMLFNTASYFKASNKTSRTLPITLQRTYCGFTCPDVGGGILISAAATGTGSATLTLDVPPTFTASDISYDRNYVYAGLTTASVTVSDLVAYYGGDITGVVFAIGNQSVSSTGSGTLSIALESAGTFIPTVTVTDSRGQTATKTYPAIIVNTYTAPSVSFDADRTDSTGVPDDEGTYVTAECTFTFADAIATLTAPSIVLTDSNGNQSTPSATWYTTRASDGTLSDPVTWANVVSGQTIYGLIPSVSTQYSYQVSIRPRDDKGTGTAIVQTIGAAFYTVDFLAGGHGIAFGQPASADGFECNMVTTFHDTVTIEDDLTVETDAYVADLYLDLSEYQTTGSVDKEIYDVLVDLGWDSEVIIS